MAKRLDDYARIDVRVGSEVPLAASFFGDYVDLSLDVLGVPGTHNLSLLNDRLIRVLDFVQIGKGYEITRAELTDLDWFKARRGSIFTTWFDKAFPGTEAIYQEVLPENVIYMAFAWRSGTIAMLWSSEEKRLIKTANASGGKE